LKLWPAVQLASADDLVLAALDDFSPTAAEEVASGLRVFFGSREHRDRAQAALRDRRIDAVAIDISDEDWAVRSQQNLTPVTVGAITVMPRLDESASGRSHSSDRGSPDRPIMIVIEPSMGFGTGHHATTRLCLAALQRTPVSGAVVLDVGTGSGILAIAAARLGAARTRGIDFDVDAIQSANENLARNPEAVTVSFEVAEIALDLPRSDIVLANLTGALLARAAPALLAALSPGGTLVVSGILEAEEDEVVRAFPACDVVWRQQEDEWVGLMFKRVSIGTRARPEA
jgi:ribosomal protein L11 methyltransferase